MKPDKPYFSKFISAVFPAVLAVFMAALYNIADTFFVAKGTGIPGVASVGMVLPLMMIVIAVSQTIGTGCSILISFDRGSEKSSFQHIAATSGIKLAVLFGVIVITALSLSRKTIFNSMGAGQIESELAEKYMLFLLPGIIPFAVTMVMENLSRSTGQYNLALKSMIIGGSFNIMLDYLLIIVLPFGVTGAAIATSLSQTCCMIFNMAVLFGRNGYFSWYSGKTVIKKILLFGIPVLIHQLSQALGLLMLYFFTRNNTNDIHLAAIGLFYKISFLFMLLHIGILQGMQPLLGYYKGQNNFVYFRKTLAYSFFSSLFISFAGFMILQLFPDKTIGIFLPSLGAIPSIVRNLRIMAFSMLFWPAGIIIGGYFLSDRNPFLSSLINASRNLIFLYPSLLTVNYFMNPFESIWTGSVVADALTALLGIILFCLSVSKGSLTSVFIWKRSVQ